MPIHLPPISRRQFISRSLVAGLGTTVLNPLVANSVPVDRDSWALLSDTHIPADASQRTRGIRMVDHFQMVSNQLLGLRKMPAGVIMAGDCALNTGELRDYRLLGDLLDPLRQAGLPLHLILGNHDNRENFLATLPKQRNPKAPLNDKHVALVKASRANWLLLDSLELTNSTPGLLGPDQLNWLERTLDADRSTPAIVVIHHNPGVEVGGGGSQPVFNISGLRDSESLLSILRPRAQVKAYVYGHTHNWSVKMDPSGIHLINLPPTAYVFREGAPSGWVLATLSSRGMDLELRCIYNDHPAHGQKYRLQWRS